MQLQQHSTSLNQVTLATQIILPSLCLVKKSSLLMLAFPLSSQNKISFTLLLLSNKPRLLFVINVSSGYIPSPVLQTFVSLQRSFDMKYDVEMMITRIVFFKSFRYRGKSRVTCRAVIDDNISLHWSSKARSLATTSASSHTIESTCSTCARK